MSPPPGWEAADKRHRAAGTKNRLQAGWGIVVPWLGIESTMNYKGYIARIEYSDADGCFIGHIAAIKDIVGFHGESVAELRGAFEEAVDDYLETCQKLNRCR